MNVHEFIDRMAMPGEVWHRHPPAGDPRHRDEHRWTVLSPIADNGNLDLEEGYPGCMVFGTSQNTPANNGMPIVEVSGLSARSGGAQFNGTKFVATRLLYTYRSHLEKKLGKLPDKLYLDIASAVFDAFGFGSGNALRERERGLSSYRGLVVRLADRAEVAFKASHAIIVTSHELSRKQYYQLIVPMREHDGTPLTPPWNGGLRVQDAPWLRDILGWKSAIISPRHVSSIFHKADLAPRSQQPAWVIPESLLGMIEGEIQLHQMVRKFADPSRQPPRLPPDAFDKRR